MALSEENVSHDKIQRSVNDWRTKYPNAAIFEKIPSMDLKEVVSTMFLVDRENPFDEIKLGRR
jgi:hypothetical protein